MLSRPLRRAAPAALALLALAGAPALGAYASRQPVDLYTAERVSDLSVTVSPDDDAVIGWTGQNNGPTVLAAVRQGATPLGPVATLSTVPNGEQPSFLFEPSGDLLAVWAHATTGEKGGYSLRPRATGAFTAQQAFPVNLRFVRAGMDRAGTTLAAWETVNASGFGMIVAATRPVGGTFGTPVPLSPVGTDAFVQPAVAVDPAGEAIVAWSRSTGAATTAIEARLGVTAGPTFGQLISLASGTGAADFLGDAAVGMARSGEAIATWTRETGPGASRVEYAIRAAGSPVFGAPATLAEGAFGARIGVSPTGTMVVAYRVRDVAGQHLEVRVREPGAAFGPPATLAPPSKGVELAPVTFDAAGAAVVAWQRQVTLDAWRAEASRRPPGGPFGPAALIADVAAAESFGAAAEPNGDVLAAWSVRSGANARTLRVGGLVFSPDPPATITAPVVPANTGVAARAPRLRVAGLRVRGRRIVLSVTSTAAGRVTVRLVRTRRVLVRVSHRVRANARTRFVLTRPRRAAAGSFKLRITFTGAAGRTTTTRSVRLR